MDPGLEAFIPFLPQTDLTDPVTDARKNVAERAAARPASDTTGVEIEDRTVPADPDVAVRIYRPHQAQGAVVWLHGGGMVFGDLDTEHPRAARIADGSGAVVISVDYRLAPPIRFQLLSEPGIDDRQQTWSQRHFTDTPHGIFLQDSCTAAVINAMMARMLLSWLSALDVARIARDRGRMALVARVGGHFASTDLPARHGMGHVTVERASEPPQQSTGGTYCAVIPAAPTSRSAVAAP
ncbi:alpha/beta hydrolase fold domain-containing protein [Nonomuraea sp. NPDC049152]|uniref:alpha/beta hydrolase n=1 Tax=Nonomuraea sp. NPDC049152 TaxID=3154350 RepID=UPI0033D2B83D